MRVDVAQWLVLRDELREQRSEHRVFQDVGVIARVVTVQVAQHDGAILRLEATTTIEHERHRHRNAERPAPDRLLTEIADYVLGYARTSAEARRIARYCLMDTLGCGILALGYPACTKLLGPVVPGASLTRRRARAGHCVTSSIP